MRENIPSTAHATAYETILPLGQEEWKQYEAEI